MTHEELQLVKLANQSPLVRNLLRVDGWKNIVKITPHSVHQFLGYQNGVPMFRARFHTARRDGRTNSLINLVYEDTFAHLGKRYGIQSYRPAEKYSFHLAPQEVCASASFNPDTNPESASVDGYVNYAPGSGTWANLIGATDGTGHFDADTTDAYFVFLQSHTVSSEWTNLYRSFFLFDTSSIGAGAEVSDADFKLYVNSVTEEGSWALSASLVGSSPASNTDLVNGDFDEVASTRFATDIALGSLSTGAYNTWSLNASGKSAVVVDGVTKFALRLDADLDNSEPTWASNQADFAKCRYANTTSDEPTLDVTYSTGGSAGINLLLMGVG